MQYPEALTNTYEIYEEIGSGGGGTVYRALHKRLKKMVVLKKIKGTSGSMEEYRTEVDILKNLRHSYLPQVLDFIEVPEGVFTVMDYIPGKSMRQRMDEGHRFGEKEILKYASQLCEALAYLHAQNPPIVHGDIKPDNIMLTPEDNVCLIDFNISGMFEGKGARTVGYTPGFSAPEQVSAFEEARRLLQQGGAIQTGQNGPKQMRPGTRPQAGTGEAVLSGAETETLYLDNAKEQATTLLQEGAENATVLLDSEEAAYQPQEAAKEYSVTVLEPLAASRKQTEAKTRIDCRSDVFSLGATLYTMLTGKLLAPGKRNAIGEISDGLGAILAKAVSYQPEHRFADAGKMLSALRQVHKKDKSYRRMVFRQNAMMVFLLALLVCSGFAIAHGKQKMEMERKERYQALVEQMEEGLDSGMEEASFEALYQEAIGMEPENIAAYAAKAYYLHEYQGEETVLAYLKKTLAQPLTGDPSIKGNVYFLYAECYFQAGDYSNARYNYEKALHLRQDNAEVYRDYAISLVYLGEIEKAKQVLETSVNNGMQQADVYMIQGELERIAGDPQKALDFFSQVLSQKPEDYLKQRAYVMASRTRQAIGTTEALSEDVSWLQQGIAELGHANLPLLYEALVQDYITLGEMTSEREYLSSAVGVLEKIVENHWDTLTTYSNLIVLTEQTGDLTAAAAWGEKMQKAYPDSYITYMRLAFVELDIQKQLDNEERDYRRFAECYRQAKQYAEEQLRGNVTDSELLMLDAAYRQVKDGGWLEQQE